MTFQTLDYIIAIAEEKSISKAADRLLLSQPALSRQLKRVEESLDTKLFAREQNEMHLTDAGKIYVNGARSIQNIYERALNDIRKLSQSGRHQITFIYNNILLPDFSTKILPDFRFQITICDDAGKNLFSNHSKTVCCFPIICTELLRRSIISGCFLCSAVHRMLKLCLKQQNLKKAPDSYEQHQK